jgi:caa(3)-type oxidase subunit IV
MEVEMDFHSVAEVKKTVRVYITVFVSLLGLTILTVAVSMFHLNIHEAIIIALAIAATKGSLVGCYFMHLIDERKVIYFALVLVAVFFCAMMFLPLIGLVDQQGLLK